MTMTSDKIDVVIQANHVPGPRQGHWTYHQYATLPEDGQRYEIVDGVLYMAPSPTGSHQGAAGEFFAHLRMHVQVAGLGRVFIAPFDVELAPKTVVQPDVFVILNAGMHKYREDRLVGAPDLVVEIASPATATYDRRTKYDAYVRAGVPEYWVADPVGRTVEVFILEAGMYFSSGVFRGKALLPSCILPGFSVPVEQLFVS
jgi:Uma2 family endonuclease